MSVLSLQFVLCSLELRPEPKEDLIHLKSRALIELIRVTAAFSLKLITTMLDTLGDTLFALVELLRPELLES